MIRKLSNAISYINVDNGTLFVDSTNDRVGIKQTTPSTALDIVGSITLKTAALQDGIVIQGRAGGASNYVATVTPTTLSANTTITLPNGDGTIILDSSDQLILAAQVFG